MLSSDLPTESVFSFICMSVRLSVFLSLYRYVLNTSSGQTQNPDELLHGIVWSRCPKAVFIGKDKLETAVCCALSVFNKGARQTTDIMSSMDI